MNVKLISLFGILILTSIGCATAKHKSESSSLSETIKSINKLNSNDNTGQITFFGKNNEFIVFDTLKGKVIPPCSKRPTADFAACKSPFKNIIDKICPKLSLDEITKTVGRAAKVKSYNNICVIEWVGSHCRTFISRSTGNEIERCYPPHP